MTYRDVFAVTQFRTVLGSFALLLISESIKMLALSVLVYTSTGSTLLAALAYVAGFLPQVLGGTLLLAFADRWRPRRLMVGYDLVRMALAAVLALAVLPPVGAMLVVFVVGSFAPVAQAARTALTADLLHGDAYILGRSLFTVVSGAMQVVGAAVGGLLLTVTGPASALWLAAGGCAASALVVRFGLTDHPARRTGDRGAVRETWQVNGALLRDRGVRRLLLAQWLPGSLMVASEGVVVPYASSLAGVLLASAAGGMLLGDLLVARFLSPVRLTPWLALMLGAPLLVFALRPGVVAASIALAVAAAGFSYQLGLAQRFLDAVPARWRGQSLGLAGTGSMVVQGLAITGAGALAEILSPGVVIAVAGAASLLSTFTLWRTLSGPAGPVRLMATGPTGGSSAR
ncbi:MFS transporter [Winogradskya humida]|uniref:MFS transporter n=1 Tax=Winogradskya humida TaxID=113566 RepID=A0ABQ3ZWS3_9ACTN|nr:MFS transporter [Actinoplanes humidus]GIE22642.1 MFS transporter [Actinoplanes humidus]